MAVRGEQRGGAGVPGAEVRAAAAGDHGHRARQRGLRQQPRQDLPTLQRAHREERGMQQGQKTSSNNLVCLYIMQVCVADHVLAVRDQLLLAVRQAAGQAEPLLALQHRGRGLLRSAVPGEKGRTWV